MKKEASYDQVTAESAITQLRKGGILLKFCRRATPHFVNIRLSSDDRYLVYNRVGRSGQKKKYISILRIADIQKGVTHRVFLGIFQYVPGRTSKLQEHSITVTYFDKKEYLRKFSIACTSNEEQQLWIHGLEQVTKFHQSQDYIQQDEMLASGYGDYSGVVVNPRSSFSLMGSAGLGVRSANGSQNDLSLSSVDPSQISFEMARVLGLPDSGHQDEYYGHNGASSSMMANDVVASQTMEHSADLNRVSRDLVLSKFNAHLPPGDLFVWGSFLDSGSLLMQDSNRPTILEGTDSLDVSKVAFGSSHGMLVTRSGGIYSWGSGAAGQLGHGICAEMRIPRRLVVGLETETIHFASCSSDQTAVITTKGELFTWGSRQTSGTSTSDGAAEAAETEDGGGDQMVPGLHTQWFPKQFSCLSSKKVLKVTCGPYHSALITLEARGNLYTWGDNFLGKLGQGPDVKRLCAPRRVEGNGFGQRTTKHVACGTWHTAAVVELVSKRENGGDALTSTSASTSPGSVGDKDKDVTAPSNGQSSLYVWGSDEEGCLGLDPEKRESLSKDSIAWTPLDVGGAIAAKDLAQVECGASHTLVLSEKGLVYQAGVCGPRAAGGGFHEVNVQHESISQIACGLHHSVVVNKKKSRVYSWGQGKEGQLGHNDFKDISEPKSVQKLASRHILDIQCGEHYTLSVCTHTGYDDAKVERQLKMAREKFQSVVGTSVVSSSHSPEEKDKKAKGKKADRLSGLQGKSNAKSAAGSGVGSENPSLANRKRARSKTKSVIKILKTYMNTKTKRKSLSDPVSMGPAVGSSKGSPPDKKKIVNVDSTLDVMTKLGDGINKVRSLSAHARDEKAVEAIIQSPPLSILSQPPRRADDGSGQGDSPVERERTSFLTIFKESEDKAKVPNMERLAKRIVDLERQISLTQIKGAQPAVTKGAQEEGKEDQGKENDVGKLNTILPQPQTPTHSRNSTWSFDLSNDADSQNTFARIRKQSQSLESFSTPLGISIKAPVMPMTEVKKQRSDSFVHLSAQNKRLKQKLKEMETRLRQQPSSKRGDIGHAAEPTQQQHQDSVALSCVEVVPGVKIFIRSMKDRTELYKVVYGGEAHVSAFREWFLHNRVDFMKTHGITHIDVRDPMSIFFKLDKTGGGHGEEETPKEEFLELLATP
ncbi:RCC1-like regulator of chromosome condensation protein [Chloropicon primus]|uniref:RCC1-like regulator of chromosome condensation protein n=1 Tax=Chloropicon primus TaxID=1764295 RepID=A0A5B8N114_9CHLO|nr:RCC1-like regulator of chromosome condensation protein [Chloropicon primus]|eukprot:QDZ25956.1 RCC1-like regulator of chromosome condensation protein [Chloropicon primus]